MCSPDIPPPPPAVPRPQTSGPSANLAPIQNQQVTGTTRGQGQGTGTGGFKSFLASEAEAAGGPLALLNTQGAPGSDAFKGQSAGEVQAEYWTGRSHDAAREFGFESNEFKHAFQMTANANAQTNQDFERGPLSNAQNFVNTAHQTAYSLFNPHDVARIQGGLDLAEARK